MYISRIELDAKTVIQNGMYEEHQALWALFSDSPHRKRDFLYRKTAPYCFLTVSERQPVRLSCVRSLESKPYVVALRSGERVAFALRCNPVVKRRDAQGRQVRVDMVQDARKRLLEQGTAPENLPRRMALAEQIAPRWFSDRKTGLVLQEDSLLVESYGQHRFTKNRGGGVSLAGMDIRGFATVENPHTLRDALYTGIGCAKGFGFGLLLVRRG